MIINFLRNVNFSAEFPAAWPTPPKQPLRLRRLDCEGFHFSAVITPRRNNCGENAGGGTPKVLKVKRSRN